MTAKSLLTALLPLVSDLSRELPEGERYRRLLLATTSAPWLYEKLGFSTPDNPKLFWHINRPDIYKQRPE